LASPYRETEKYNPVTSLLYQAMEEQGAEVEQFTGRRLAFESWDVWHLHWPEQVLGVSRWLPWNLFKFWAKLKIARAKKIKIFWTVHNLRPHERRYPFFERIFWWILLPNVDGFICMARSGREQLHIEHSLTRKLPVFIIPHGHYRDVYPDNINKDEARRTLGIGTGETVIAFIGLIRGYKGVPHLIRCFNAAALPASRLLIAGEPQDEILVREIDEAVSGNTMVQLHLRFIGEEELQLHLRAADLVVLPYKDILNSGSALLALSFDRPILVPNRGALGELCEVIGPEWVRLYVGDLTPQILSDALLWAAEVPVNDRGSAPLESLSWRHIAALTIAAFSAPLNLRQNSVGD
jgi:beta-1,4-mannosyltransferase